MLLAVFLTIILIFLPLILSLFLTILYQLYLRDCCTARRENYIYTIYLLPYGLLLLASLQTPYYLITSFYIRNSLE